MIPASYLFKNAYHQTWEIADEAVTPTELPHFLTGLLSPLTAAITSLFALGQSRPTHRFGKHAYE